MGVRIGHGEELSSREVIKKLTADGWVLARTKGSHHQFTHPTKPGVVTVPHPKKDLPTGTLKSILKSAGLVEVPALEEKAAETPAVEEKE